jgi:hypothetical protein
MFKPNQRIGRKFSINLLLGGSEYFMKIASFIFGALLVAGCTSTQPSTSLTAEQAMLVAVQLANEKAAAIYHRRPFHDGQLPNFVAGHWIWRQLSTGDIEATVGLASDGSTNSVVLNLLTEK